jgi:hypothetical protein
LSNIYKIIHEIGKFTEKHSVLGQCASIYFMASVIAYITYLLKGSRKNPKKYTSLLRILCLGLPKNFDRGSSVFLLWVFP